MLLSLIKHYKSVQRTGSLVQCDRRTSSCWTPPPTSCLDEPFCVTLAPSGGSQRELQLSSRSVSLRATSIALLHACHQAVDQSEGASTEPTHQEDVRRTVNVEWTDSNTIQHREKLRKLVNDKTLSEFSLRWDLLFSVPAGKYLFTLIYLILCLLLFSGHSRQSFLKYFGD